MAARMDGLPSGSPSLNARPIEANSRPFVSASLTVARTPSRMSPFTRTPAIGEIHHGRLGWSSSGRNNPAPLPAAEGMLIARSLMTKSWRARDFSIYPSMYTEGFITTAADERPPHYRDHLGCVRL